MSEILSQIESVAAELAWIRSSSLDAVARRRANILLVYKRLQSQRKTAWTLGHARSTVQAALEEFGAHGLDGINDRRRGTAPYVDRTTTLERLRTLAASSPQDHGWARTTWTIELFARQLALQGGVKISRSLVGRLLREAGCRRRVPAQTIRRAPEDKADRMRDLATVLSQVGDDDVILSSDEVDIHLNPKIGPDWMPPGIRKEVATPGQNAKAYIAGAFEPLTGDLIAVSGFSKSSALFIALLDAIVDRYPHAPTIHIVVDNYVIHKSKITQKALERLKGKVKLHFLPPYSPDCNPIERVWWNLHAVVTRNHRCRSIGELLVEVEAFITAYDGAGQARAGLRRAA
jgi:transposase